MMKTIFLKNPLALRTILLLSIIVIIAGLINSAGMINGQILDHTILNHSKNFSLSEIRTPFPSHNEIAPPGGHSNYDRPDDSPGKYQIHILYVVPKGFEYPIRDLDGSIDEQISLVNEWFASQADGAMLRFECAIVMIYHFDFLSGLIPVGITLI